MWRPTAACIWNSFRRSGKRHLLLTGGRGAGKSARLAALAAALPAPPPTLATQAVPGRGDYLRENGGPPVQVGRFDPALPGPENRMRPLAGAFAAFGTAALGRCAAAPGPWAVIDEIGYLETACPPYLAALEALMRQKCLLAAVRKQPLPALEALLRRPDVFVVDLDAPYGRAGCVVMASGLGRRFGGDKLLAQFNGRPLLSYALAASAGVFERRVVVTRSAAAAQLARAAGVPAVLHALPERRDTIRLGLQALGGGLDTVAFLPGDQPLLQRGTLAGLALCAANARQDIWRPGQGARAGAPVFFPAWAFGQLAALPPGAGGGAVARRWPARVRLWPVCPPWGGWELADVDRPQDLARLQKVAQSVKTV